MQKNIRKALASASCALLASAVAHAENPAEVGDWDIDSAFLLYSETDRVQAAEAIVSAKKYIDTDESITFKVTLDTLTGASGSGAVPSNTVQTFTQPSGNGDYQVAAGEYPLDTTFLDTRAAINALWNRPAWWGTQASLGFNFSREYDYQSIGVSSLFAKNFNNANTTFTFGGALAADFINPVGGAPVAYSVMQAAVDDEADDNEDGQNLAARSSDESKNLFDIITGVTQIIDANSLFQLNYAVSIADGYLTDPYKVVSVVDADTGDVVFENAVDSTLPTVVYEKRPDSRTKHSFFGQYKHIFPSSGDVLDTSYRFMLDDWGINSHTVDFKYRKSFSDRHFVQPHVRLYQQSAADFYTPFFLTTNSPATGASSSYASADYRLGDFTGITLGLEYGQVNTRNSWSVAFEYYLQTGDEPSNKFGALNQLELYPDVDAVMVKFLYDF